jgi:hypothetical protein
LVGNDGEQSICRCCQPNSLAISNESEELFPISNRLGRTSLLMKRTGGKEHEEAEPARDPGGPRGHARQQAGTRSSSPYQGPTGGNTDTSTARGRCSP